MKSTVKFTSKLILIGIFVQALAYTKAESRGQLPPPPPFTGGGAGEWLGSGPVFGFEPPSAKNPWIGAGGDGIGNGGSMGGWGGAWWDGDGPLGGGGWGGWGGWGSGLHEPIGGSPADTGKKGHIIIADQTDPGYGTTCFKETEVGGVYKCLCTGSYSLEAYPPLPGSWVEGTCEREEDRELNQSYSCLFPGNWCSFQIGVEYGGD